MNSKGHGTPLGRIAPDRLSSLSRVATIKSIGSSTRIEGAKLSDREVEAPLSNLRIGSFTTREEREGAGYAAVMETIFNAYDAIPLTEDHRREDCAAGFVEPARGKQSPDDPLDSVLNLEAEHDR